MSQKVALILPYGVFEEANLQYKSYLDTALTKVLEAAVTTIVISGGYSNKNFPTLSEAQSIKNYFVSIKPEITDQVVVEEQALTTIGSIEIVSKMFALDQIVCDSIRAPKVFYLACLNILHMPEEEIYRELGKQSIGNPDVTRDMEYRIQDLTITGININRTITEVGHQIISSMEEVAFAKYPNLHQEYIAYRKKLWGIE